MVFFIQKSRLATVAREAAKHYIVELDKYTTSMMKELEEAKDVLFAAQKKVLDQFDDIRKFSSIIYWKDK